MPIDRRPFRRETEETRREALISAALDLVGEGGAGAATVRAISDRAGVTPGLIRHYFTSKDELLRAAYRTLMDGMTGRVIRAATDGHDDPAFRLAAFIEATLTSPVASPDQVVRWAGFLHRVRADPELSEAHWVGYIGYRDALQTLIADLPRGPRSESQLVADAIACNALLDGLWLEISLLPERLDTAQFVRIGLNSVGAILGVDLSVRGKEHGA